MGNAMIEAIGLDADDTLWENETFFRVTEAGRRELIESAARREVLMMVPVVFLVLPVTVLFALFPGLISIVSLAQ